MAFTFSPWIDKAARVAAVVGTGYLLIATSAVPSDPQVCLHEALRLHLQVDGTCGPPTTIAITSAEDECAIAVMNATPAKLPAAGRFDTFEGTRVTSLRTDPWTISGYETPNAPDAGGLAPLKHDAAVSRDGASASGDIDAQGAEPFVGGDAGASPDAFFVTAGDPQASAPRAQRHCRVRFEQGIPRLLSCYATASQLAKGTPTCTAIVTEVPAN